MREPFFPTRSADDIARDNRAEIEAWIDERAEALAAAGLPAAEARRRALDEFGDATGAEQYGRRQDATADRRIRLRLWIEDLASDLRIAGRTLRRTPTVSAVVLLTFALGTGAATSVFSVVHALLLRALPYGEERGLVQLQPVENGGVRPAARWSAAALTALRDRTTSFAAIAGVTQGNVVARDHGDPEQIILADVTPDGFDVLQVRPALGRGFAAPDAAGSWGRVVILLDGLWRRRFGADPAIVGRTIGLDSGRAEVIGVMPAAFRVPTYEAAELLAPRDLAPLLASAVNSQVRVLRLFARLKPGASTEAAQADVDRVMRGLQAEQPRAFTGIDARVVPIRTAVAGEARPRLLVLMGAAVFVLLIACANVAGILLSRAVARRHELSVRVALGAGRRRLVRQFLAEGALLAALGAGLAVGVAEAGIVVLRRIAVAALPPGTTFALEPGVLTFALAVAVVAAFVASLVPALAASRLASVAPPGDAGRVSPSPGTRRLRVGLVAAQLAVATLLLVGTGLFLRTLHRLSTLDVGYATEQVLTFRLPFGRPLSAVQQAAFWTSLFDALGAIPGVVAVGAGNVPMSGQSTVVGLEVEGRPLDRGRLPDVRYTFASDAYFATLGIPVVRGRGFGPSDRDGAPWVAVVSAGLATALWPNGDPIGAKVRTEPRKPWATIVGIVGDVRSGSADRPVPSIYTSHRQDAWPGGAPVVVRTAGDPEALMAPVRQAIARVDPAMPIVGLRTLEDFRQGTPAIAERRMQMQMLLVFALVALGVSAIGVYGVAAYATEARRREFGIRIALGASPSHVLWLALRESAAVAVVGAFAGILLASLLASRLRGLLFSIAPLDPPTMLVVAPLVLLVALAASLVPARRAARINPASTMRTD